MERHERVIRNVQDLPTLPEVVRQINKMLSDPRTSAKQISSVISRDPSITAKLLRVVNSSFYTFPNPITKISMAIVVLGYNTIKSLILGASVFGAFPANARTTFSRTEFWKHTMAAAAAARVLAKRLGKKETEPYFIGGLLHDIGKVLEDQFFTEEFSKVLDRVEEKNCLILDAEREVIETDHAQIGAVLLERWELSADLIDAVRWHHEPHKATVDPEFAYMLHAADIIARTLMLGNGGDRQMPRLLPQVADALKLAGGDFPAILDATVVENRKAMVFSESG